MSLVKGAGVWRVSASLRVGQDTSCSQLQTLNIWFEIRHRRKRLSFPSKHFPCFTVLRPQDFYVYEVLTVTGRMEPRGLGHTTEELSTALKKLVLVLQVTPNYRRPESGWMNGF